MLLFTRAFRGAVLILWVALLSGPLASPTMGSVLVGRVLNASKQPLPGVTVALRGEANLVTTNAAGDFLLPCGEVVPVLVFRYAGYHTLTVLVKEPSKIAVTLYQVGTAVLPPPSGLELVAEPVAEFEEAPVFPGGTSAYQAYLRQNMHYPPAAIAQNIAGTVLVGFMVDEKGRVSEAEIVKGCAGLDKEALRLVLLMPWWTPARRQGQPVRAVFYLRIKFELAYNDY